MVKQPGRQTVSRRTELATPVQEIALPIALADWRRLKVRLRRCAGHIPPYGSITSTMAGMSVSAVLSALSIHVSVKPLPLFPVIACWFIAALTGCAAALAYSFGRRHQESLNDSIELIVEDLEELEARYELPYPTEERPGKN